MNTPVSDPYDIVCGDPAAYFTSPQAVLDDVNLTRAEKLELLDEWAHDLSDRNSAAEEGMIPDAAGPIDRDVTLGAAIVAARALVDASPDTPPPSLPMRLWRRLTGAVA
jgi:hypothetical protein